MPYFESGGGNATSGTISGSLGFTIKWVKFGKVVNMYMTNDTTRIPIDASEITTLPDNLAPELTISQDAYRAFDNKCAFGINATTKKLSIYNGSGSQQYYISGDLTYVSKE